MDLDFHQVMAEYSAALISRNLRPAIHSEPIFETLVPFLFNKLDNFQYLAWWDTPT